MKPIHASQNAMSSTPALSDTSGCGAPGMRPVFCVFEKEKTTAEVVGVLTESHLFAAPRPGTCTTTPGKVVEVLTTTHAPMEELTNTLKRTFTDFVETTTNCCLFTIAVPSNEYKQAKEALKQTALKTNTLERVRDGKAYFEIVTTPMVTAEQISTCLQDSKIEACSIEPTPLTPCLPGMPCSGIPYTTTLPQTSTWPEISFFPAGYTTGTGYDMRAICQHVFPMLVNECQMGTPVSQVLASLGIPPQAFRDALIYAARCWSLSFGTPHDRSWTPLGYNTTPAGITPMIRRIATELRNPNSALCSTINQLGIRPEGVYYALMPFCSLMQAAGETAYTSSWPTQTSTPEPIHVTPGY